MTVEQDRTASAESSRFRRNVSRKGAKDAKTQRRVKCFGRAFASLRSLRLCLKSSSVTFIDKDDKVTPDVGFEKEVIPFDRLPRGRAILRLG